MADSDSLKDSPASSPDAKVVHEAASGYENEYNSETTHGSTERSDETIPVERYTTRAFRNLRLSAIWAMLDERVRNVECIRTRRQAIIAVLGEEAWKDVALQYAIVGPAWNDAEAVTRALEALELASSASSGNEWDAWRKIATSANAAFLEIPQRIQWLEKHGYITDRTSPSYQPGYYPILIAWVYFAILVTLLPFAVVKTVRWLWRRMGNGVVSEGFEATPPRKRRRKTFKKPTGDIKRAVQYHLEYVKAKKGVKDDVMSNRRKPAIVVQTSSQEDFYPDDSQYTEDTNQARNSYSAEPEQQYEDDVNNETYEEEYYDAEKEGNADEDGYLSAATTYPQQQSDSPTDAEDTESDFEPDTGLGNYAGQDKGYRGEDVYNDANEEEGGNEDDADYSIIEEEVSKIPIARVKTKKVQQQPQRYQLRAKAGHRNKAPINPPTRPPTKSSQPQQTVPLRKRR